MRESRRADIAQSLQKSALIVGEVGIAAGGGLRWARGAQVDATVEREGVQDDADGAVCVVERHADPVLVARAVGCDDGEGF